MLHNACQNVIIVMRHIFTTSVLRDMAIQTSYRYLSIIGLSFNVARMNSYYNRRLHPALVKTTYQTFHRTFYKKHYFKYIYIYIYIYYY